MNTDEFDYSAPAELYITQRKARGRAFMDFRRFDTAASAIRFSIEELPAARLVGSLLEVDEQRYQHTEIRDLYESEHYPLKREPAEVEDAEKAELQVRKIGTGEGQSGKKGRTTEGQE